MKKWILKIAALVSILGFIIFFPVNINNRYTCLYHRMFDSAHDYCPVYNDVPANEMEAQTMMHVHTDGFIRMYVHKYAWLWWGSFGLISLLWIKRKDNNDEEQK